MIIELFFALRILRYKKEYFKLFIKFFQYFSKVFDQLLLFAYLNKIIF